MRMEDNKSHKNQIEEEKINEKKKQSQNKWSRACQSSYPSLLSVQTSSTPQKWQNKSTSTKISYPSLLQTLRKQQRIKSPAIEGQTQQGQRAPTTPKKIPQLTNHRTMKEKMRMSLTYIHATHIWT